MQLDQLAREFDTTILVVRHLRKGDSNDALYRGLGSIAIAARVRSILLLGRHPRRPRRESCGPREIELCALRAYHSVRPQWGRSWPTAND
jgi:hypothetical protein